MAQLPISSPLNIVALIGANKERLGAALVSVGIQALFDGVVHDFAFGDCFGLEGGEAGGGEGGDEHVLEGNVHVGGEWRCWLLVWWVLFWL